MKGYLISPPQDPWAIFVNECLVIWDQCGDIRLSVRLGVEIKLAAVEGMEH